ncbi:MAG TPA: hypothetical protein PKD64_05705 [Pirellulaceae bacterium]|nr:hypothetical protein [Pirellulaceae bacterium]HMO91674.1 hypothetical protein [Pirellulaceae bacterium]HMP68371.1 hypothetical protein [Pirellulaceae bacterium]
MFRTDLLLKIAVVIFVFSVCHGTSIGQVEEDWKQIKVDAATIEYNAQTVSKETADAAVNYLKISGYLDASEQKVRITKRDGIWQLLLIADKEIGETEIFQETVAVFGAEFSAYAFQGEPTEVLLCNESFETYSVWRAKDFGKAIVAEGTLIFYDEKIISKEIVEKLGKYLVDSGFSDGAAKTIQLAKKDQVWQFRFVIKEEFADNEDFFQLSGVMAMELSRDMFDGAPAEVHLCDTGFKLIRVATAISYGTAYSRNKTDIYYDEKTVNKQIVEDLADFLEDSGFIDGEPKSVQLAKPGSTWQFRFVVQESFLNDSNFHDLAKQFGRELSEELFAGGAIEVHLCNEYFLSKKVLKIAEKL